MRGCGERTGGRQLATTIGLINEVMALPHPHYTNRGLKCMNNLRRGEQENCPAEPRARCCPTNSGANKTVAAFKPLNCRVVYYAAGGEWDNYPSLTKGSSDKSNCLTGKWACKLGNKRQMPINLNQSWRNLVDRWEQKLGPYSQPVWVQVLDLTFPYPSCAALSKLLQSLQFSISSSVEWTASLWFHQFLVLVASNQTKSKNTKWKI